MNSDMHVDTLMFHTLNLELSPSTDNSPPLPSVMDCSSFNTMNQQGLFGNSFPESTEGASSGGRFAFYDCHEDFMSAGLLDNYPQFLPDNSSQEQQQHSSVTVPPSLPIQIPVLQASLQAQEAWNQFFLPHFSYAHIPSVPEFTMQPESTETMQGSQVAAWHVTNYAHLNLDMIDLPTELPSNDCSKNDSFGLPPVPGQEFFDLMPGTLVQGDFMTSISPSLLSSSAPDRSFHGLEGGQHHLSASLPSCFEPAPSRLQQVGPISPSSTNNDDGNEMEVDNRCRPVVSSVIVVDSDNESPEGFKKRARRTVNPKDTDKPKAQRQVLNCTHPGCQVTCSSYPSLQRHQDAHKWRGRYAPVKCEACQSSLSNEFSVQRHINRSQVTSRCRRMRVYSIMNSETEIDVTVRFYPRRPHGKKTVRVNLEHMKHLYWNASSTDADAN